MKVKCKLWLYILVLMSALASCRSVPTPTASPMTSLTEITPSINPTQTEPPQPIPFEPIDSQIRAADGINMVYVPAGKFVMGYTEEQIDQVIQDCLDTYGTDAECHREVDSGLRPAHTVSLDAFWLDQTEVTNAMFTAFLNVHGNQSENGVDWFEPGTGHRGVVYGHIREHLGVFKTQAGYEDHPVVEVSWYGAAAYCGWAGGRLPSEA